MRGLHSIHFTLILILLGIFPSAMYAQAPSAFHFDFEKLDKRDGLSNDTYNSFLYKDTHGYLWVSSTQGVYKYDGYTFKYYNADTELDGGMIGNNVQSDFYEDEIGNIWFSTYTGLNKYDRTLDKVFGYTIPDKTGNDIKSSYHIFHIDVSKQVLWLLADKVICRYSYNSNQVLEYLPFEVNSVRLFPKLDNNGNVEEIYGTPWMLGNGIESLHKTDTSWNYNRITYEKEIGKNRVSDILFTNNQVWLISDKGILKLNQNDSIEKRLIPNDLSNTSMYKGLVFSEDQILFSNTDGVLNYFDLNNEKFRHAIGIVEGQEMATSCDLYMDKDSILWAGFGTGGIGRADIKKKALTKKSRKIYDIKNLKRIIHQGRTYLLTKENEFIILDDSVEKNILHEVDLKIKVVDFIITKDSQLFFIDKSSIYSYKTESKTLKQELKLNFNPLEINEVQDEIVLCTFNGMFLWDKEAKEVQSLRYNTNTSNKAELKLGQFFSNENEFLMFVDAETASTGEISDKAIIVNQSVSYDGFVHDAISIQDNWFFVTVNGLYRLDGQFNLQKLSFQEYLSDMGFSAIVSLGQEKLLLGNSDGLYSYNINDSKLHKLNYLINDKLNVIPKGLQLTDNNNLLVAGDEELYIVKREDLEYDVKKPTLKVKSVEINNRVYKNTNVLTEPDSKIELGYNDKFLGLELQCEDARLIGGGEIRYKDSRSNQWQNIVNGKLGFENLTPGNFELSFVALDKNMNASEIKTLHIIVKEPFFRSSAFFLLMAFLVAAISFATGKIIEKVKGNRLQRKLVLQLAQEQERNRIASMIHDDMGAILSTIQFASEDLSMDVKDEVLKNKALSIQNDAKDLLSRMRTNIWALKSETKALNELCRELRKSAIDQISALSINLEYPINDQLPNVNLSGATCMEIMLIQKESLNNIVKHAQAENILVTAKYIDKKFILRIKDDGKGISEDHTPGMGTTNMTKRAKAIKGVLSIDNSSCGVTVHLEVPVQISN